MTLQITSEEFNLLRNYIRSECGISLEEGKEYLVESRFAKLVAETGSSTFGEFYLKVANAPKREFRDKIIDAITTNETSWFRDATPYKIMEEHVLPTLIQNIKDGKQIKARIWSAACSTGQEPYTISMLISELCEKMGGGRVTPANFEVLATDISPSTLFLASTGRYDQISISRGLPENYKNKYFTNKGKVWILNNSIKKMVTFKKYNLQNTFSLFGSFDLVLCRNVAIYFSDEFKKDLFARLAAVLKPNGFFFIGSAESLSGYSDKFKMNTMGTGVYYTLQ